MLIVSLVVGFWIRFSNYLFFNLYILKTQYGLYTDQQLNLNINFFNFQILFFKLKCIISNHFKHLLLKANRLTKFQPKVYENDKNLEYKNKSISADVSSK